MPWGTRCDFSCVRHGSDAGDGWERIESICQIRGVIISTE